MTKKEQLLGWLTERVGELYPTTKEYVGFIMEEYKKSETELPKIEDINPTSWLKPEEQEIPDVSWLWHASTKVENMVDYGTLLDDEKVVPALNRAYMMGFRWCLRKIEDLEIVEMCDIDRACDRNDQEHFDIAFNK